MSLKVKVKSEAVEFPPIPEGAYTAICYTIADLGEQYNDKFKKTANKVMFIWEIVDDDLRIDIDGEMKRRAISKQYTASFGQKSNMYKDIRPWIGREFTKEEQEGTFDLTSLIEKGCLLNITNDKAADGKIYANVSSVMPLPKGIKVGKPEKLICKKWRLSFVPFKGGTAKMEIAVRDDMEYKITSNSQCDENTRFA